MDMASCNNRSVWSEVKEDYENYLISYDTYKTLQRCTCPARDICGRCVTLYQLDKHEEKLRKMNNLNPQTRDLTMNNNYTQTLALSSEKQYISLDKENGQTVLYKSLEEAKADTTRKLREGKEFLILKLIASVRPKPIDAEVEEYE